MSTTRTIQESLTQPVNPSASAAKSFLSLKSSDITRFLIPVSACAAGGALFSLPSVAYAVLSDSLLPAYTLRGMAAGAVIGGVAVAWHRYTGAEEKAVEEKEAGYASLVTLDESIGSDTGAKIISKLRKAFKDPESKGVVLKINCRGGSPVQSSLIHDAILSFKKEYKKRLIVVAEDFMASGAYYIAVAADKIYVNPNTLAGSIGVISWSYGYAELAKKLGVESRVHTAGDNKCHDDPMKPEKDSAVAKTKALLKEIHQDFIQAVVTGREGKLKASHEFLFNGDVWTGKTALELGLVDALGSLSDALEKEFQVKHSKDQSKSIMNLDVSRLLGSLFKKAVTETAIEMDQQPKMELRLGSV